MFVILFFSFKFSYPISLNGYEYHMKFLLTGCGANNSDENKEIDHRREILFFFNLTQAPLPTCDD